MAGSVKAALAEASTSASGSHAGDLPEGSRISGPAGGSAAPETRPSVGISMLPMKAAKEP